MKKVSLNSYSGLVTKKNPTITFPESGVIGGIRIVKMKFDKKTKKDKKTVIETITPPIEKTDPKFLGKLLLTWNKKCGENVPQQNAVTVPTEKKVKKGDKLGFDTEINHDYTFIINYKSFEQETKPVTNEK